MAVAFGSATENADPGSSVSTIDINVPSGVSNGHLLLLWVSMRGAQTMTTPSGWTLREETTTGTGSGDVRLLLFWRIASSEPASYTLTFSATARVAVVMARYTGAHATTPIDVSAIRNGGGTTDSTPDAPSVTTTVANTMLVCGWGMGGDHTGTAPSGMTERADTGVAFSATRSMYVCDEAIAATGATGTRTATMSAADEEAGVSVAIAPAAAGAQTISAAGAIATAEAFGTATLLPGAVALSPSAIATAEAFGTATLLPGAVTVSPSGTATAEEFGTTVVVPGAITITGVGDIATAEAFGTAVVTSLGTAISPSGIASGEAFGEPTLLPGAVTISPSGIDSQEAFGLANIAWHQIIEPGDIESAEAFGTPSVLPGAVVLTPSGITTGEAFGVAVLLVGAVVVLPSAIASAEAFGTPTVEVASVSAALTTFLSKDVTLRTKVEEDAEGSTTVNKGLGR